jgi:hypothetical protein
VSGQRRPGGYSSGLIRVVVVPTFVHHLSPM